MGAAVPVIGQIIASVVVSKAASTIASKIGLSDSAAQLVGIVAGGFAAAQVPGGIGTSGVGKVAGGQAGMDLSLQTQGADFSIGNMASPAAPSSGIDLTLAGAPSAGQGITMAGQGAPVASGGGMLSGGLAGGRTPNLSVGGGAATQIGTSGNTAGDIIRSEGGTVTPAGGDTGTKTSWWEKLISPDKTADLIAAGIGGMSNSALLKYQTEAKWDREDEVGKDWASAYPGQQQINSN